MSDTATIMSRNQALAWLVENSPVTVASYTELANVFGWQRAKTWKVIQGWKRKGWVETETSPADGKLTASIVPTAIPVLLNDDASDDDGDAGSHSEREVSSPLPEASDER